MRRGGDPRPPAKGPRTPRSRCTVGRPPELDLPLRPRPCSWPVPSATLGTLGSLRRLGSLAPSRAALFDVAAAGVAAGAGTALALVLLGLHFSHGGAVAQVRVLGERGAGREEGEVCAPAWRGAGPCSTPRPACREMLLSGVH